MGACLIVAVATLIASGWNQSLPALGFLAALAAFAFAAYFRPSVDIYAERVEFINVATIATVPFSRLESIGTKWALDVRADDSSKATAFAAPAPSAMKARTVTANQAHWNPDIATLIYTGGPGTSTSTASGAAAHMVDDAYQAWKNGEAAPDAAATGAPPAEASEPASASAMASGPDTTTASRKAITRRPNWLSIAVLATGIALFVLSFSLSF